MHSSLLMVLRSERILRQGAGIVRPAAFRRCPTFGQNDKIMRRWAKRGTRPSSPQDPTWRGPRIPHHR